MSYSYEHPRPAVTVDCVVFGLDELQQLKVMLIQRGIAPFKNQWALPGGFVQWAESVDAAAARELQEETGIEQIFLEQLYTFGEINRDPRDRVITVAYYALINIAEYQIRAQTDASNAAWFLVQQVPDLAFDHQQILKVAQQRLKGKLRYQPIGFELLPQKFTLTQLQRLYETVLEQKLDKRNFRHKLLKMKLLIDTEQMQDGVSHRPAKLYQFDEARYVALKETGFNFEI
jgi:8-oxo-dGTP diphosphatase